MAMTKDESETAVVRRDPPSTGGLIIAALAAAIGLALAAVACLTLLSVQDERSATDREASALARSRDAAVAFASYDYRRIDADLKRLQVMSTGDFGKQFASALGALTGKITKVHGVSVGTVTQIGLLRSEETSAVAIAAVDASITNTELKGPSLRRYRLQITLTRDADTWLVSDVQAVP